MGTPRWSVRAAFPHPPRDLPHRAARGDGVGKNRIALLGNALREATATVRDTIAVELAEHGGARARVDGLEGLDGVAVMIESIVGV